MDGVEYQLQKMLFVESVVEAATEKAVAAYRAIGIELAPDQIVIGRAAARASAEEGVARL